jgi:hypothetical protein
MTQRFTSEELETGFKIIDLIIKGERVILSSYERALISDMLEVDGAVRTKEEYDAVVNALCDKVYQ